MQPLPVATAPRNPSTVGAARTVAWSAPYRRRAAPALTGWIRTAGVCHWAPTPSGCPAWSSAWARRCSAGSARRQRRMWRPAPSAH
eukprot:scaffold5708_cov107-Isochrysis_galbana.AAC.6